LKHITIIANSVALRVRPPELEKRSYNKVYSTHLEEKLNKEGEWSVKNLGWSRRMVTEFEANRDLFVSTFPKYFIINLGCVDAPTREIPLWYSDIIFRRKNQNLFRPFNWFYLKVIKNFFRKPLVWLRGKRSWVSKKKFSKHVKIMLDTLLKETSAEIIVLGINSGNQRIEDNLPGTLENYLKYNEMLQQQCERSFVHFIDVSDLKSETHFPDGIHYNSKGHQIIATRLFEKISELENG